MELSLNWPHIDTTQVNNLRCKRTPVRILLLLKCQLGKRVFIEVTHRVCHVQGLSLSLLCTLLAYILLFHDARGWLSVL